MAWYVASELGRRTCCSSGTPQVDKQRCRRQVAQGGARMEREHGRRIAVLRRMQQLLKVSALLSTARLTVMQLQRAANIQACDGR